MVIIWLPRGLAALEGTANGYPNKLTKGTVQRERGIFKRMLEILDSVCFSLKTTNVTAVNHQA